jgi:PAS domain S-box-containing protein
MQQPGLLQTVINAIPAPIFYKDHAGVYLGCNEAFEKFIGLSREGIVGKTVYDVAPKDLADVYYAADEALLRSGEPRTYEASVRYADGSRHEVLFHKTVFHEADGRLGGLVGTMVDITERKEAEAKALYLVHFDPLTELPNRFFSPTALIRQLPMRIVWISASPSSAWIWIISKRSTMPMGTPWGTSC